MSSQTQPNYPQHHQQRAAQREPSPAQKLQALLGEVRDIKSDLVSAVNPYTLNKILSRVVDVLEFMITGRVTQAEPNQVPGHAPVDPQQARVQIFQTLGQVNAMAPAPQAPVIGGGDVQFMGRSTGSISGGDGQTVEFYDGPNHSGQGAQKVEYYGGPEQGTQAPLPAAPAPTALVPGAFGPPSAASFAEVRAVTPASNQPAGHIIPNQQTLTVEAGGAVRSPIGVQAMLPYAPEPAAQIPNESLLGNLGLPLGLGNQE